DIEADAGLDFCGLDAYPHAGGALNTVDQARYLAASSKLAYFPEYGAGSWPFDFRVRDTHDQESTMLAPLMGGARGLNFYMLVERERWFGSPLDVHGKRHEETATLFERFNTFLRESEWSKATPLNQGLVLRSREGQLYEAVFDMPTSRAERKALPYALRRASESDLLPGAGGSPLASEASAFYKASRAFCAQRHFSFAIADSAASPERLARHAFVLASLPGFMDEALARRLRSYVEGGGLLVLGPAWPRLNTRFEPLKAFEGLQPEPGKPLSVGDGKILWLKAFETNPVAGLLRKGKVFEDTGLSDPDLELAAHRSAGRLLLFVRNPHAEERRAMVLREGKFVLKP
ncbi:MAG: hypothetical protein ACREKE_03005, partial [bacterium]